jgi:hypothetical protein
MVQAFLPKWWWDLGTIVCGHGYAKAMWFCTCNCWGQLISHVQCQWVVGSCKLVNGLGCGSSKCAHYYASNTKVVQDINQFHISGV